MKEERAESSWLEALQAPGTLKPGGEPNTQRATDLKSARKRGEEGSCGQTPPL